ncbi:unnamed protein product, partial [Amoebophrya sp. A120]
LGWLIPTKTREPQEAWDEMWKFVWAQVGCPDDTAADNAFNSLVASFADMGTLHNHGRANEPR